MSFQTFKIWLILETQIRIFLKKPETLLSLQFIERPCNQKRKTKRSGVIQWMWNTKLLDLNLSGFFKNVLICVWNVLLVWSDMKVTKWWPNSNFFNLISLFLHLHRRWSQASSTVCSSWWSFTLCCMTSTRSTCPTAMPLWSSCLCMWASACWPFRWTHGAPPVATRPKRWLQLPEPRWHPVWTTNWVCSQIPLKKLSRSPCPWLTGPYWPAPSCGSWLEWLCF